MVIRDTQAQILGFLLRCHARHIAQVAVYFDGDGGYTRLVPVRVLLDDVSEQPLQNEQAVTDEMVIGLPGNRPRQSCLTHFLCNEEASTLLFRMSPAHYLIERLYQQEPGEGSTLVQLSHAKRPSQQVLT